MKNLHIEFDVPEMPVVQAGLDESHLSTEARKIFALFLYEHGKLSRGKACELGGISQWEFALLNSQLGIPVDYTDSDLAYDMKRLKNV
jgi:predicted HTH domain antitoxin